MSSHRDIARGPGGGVAFAGAGKASGRGSGVSAARPRASGRQPRVDDVPDGGATSQIRTDVARFFVDLRRTIGVSPVQAAAHLRTSLPVIFALEQADIHGLPPWHEVQRIVTAYAAWTGIDGRPVLTALGILLREAAQRRQMARQAEALRPAMNATSERLRQMRTVIAESAMRLPMEALNQARERPVRTFYALSLPLGLVLVMLNANVLGGALSQLPVPFKAAAGYLHDVMAVHFAPEREGLKWIEVTDPRSRRSDRLHQHER